MNEPQAWRQRRLRESLACLSPLLLLVSFLIVSPASAQVPGGVRPDVQVIVMPHPSGDWAISVVYPKVVDKAAMQAHMRRLLQVSGWKAGRGGVEYESRGLRYNDGTRRDRPGPVGPTMSSATFQTSSPVVDWREATLPVEPWARAYRDLNRVYITYFVPGSFRFRGLRRHSDENLDVSLTEERGAYTYALQIKNHGLDRLDLPRFQVRQEPDAGRIAAGEAERRSRLRMVGTALVVLLAAGAGLLVYIGAHRWSGR